MEKTRIEIAADALGKEFEDFIRGFGYTVETHPAHDTILIVLRPANDIVPPADHCLKEALENRLNHTFKGFPFHISFDTVVGIPNHEA